MQPCKAQIFFTALTWPNLLDVTVVSFLCSTFWIDVLLMPTAYPMSLMINVLSWLLNNTCIDTCLTFMFSIPALSMTIMMYTLDRPPFFYEARTETTDPCIHAWVEKNTCQSNVSVLLYPWVGSNSICHVLSMKSRFKYKETKAKIYILLFIFWPLTQMSFDIQQKCIGLAVPVNSVESV